MDTVSSGINSSRLKVVSPNWWIEKPESYTSLPFRELITWSGFTPKGSWKDYGTGQKASRKHLTIGYG